MDATAPHLRIALGGVSTPTVARRLQRSTHGTNGRRGRRRDPWLPPVTVLLLFGILMPGKTQVLASAKKHRYLNGKM